MNNRDKNIVGQILAKTYRIERFLGAGTVGTVYVARHVRSGGLYAVKVLHRKLAASPDLYQRFQDEARLIATLRHPHILPITDFDRDDNGIPFFVMDLLEGENLQQRLKHKEVLPGAQAIEIIQQVGGALHTAHRSGIVHRNIKPENVFLVRHDLGDRVVESARVMDFGLARFRRMAPAGTRDASLGVSAYMAPETLSETTTPIDGRTDQWALAVIAYRMLSGKLPWEDGNPDELLRQIIHEPPRPLPRTADLPAHTVAAISRGMSKRREDRYETMMDFVRALTARTASTAQADGAGGDAVPHARPPVPSGRVAGQMPPIPSGAAPPPLPAAAAGTPSAANPSSGTPPRPPAAAPAVPGAVPIVQAPAPRTAASVPTPPPAASPPPMLHEPSLLFPNGSPSAPPAMPRRTPWAPILGGAALAILTGIGLTLVWEHRQRPRPLTNPPPLTQGSGAPNTSSLVVEPLAPPAGQAADDAGLRGPAMPQVPLPPIRSAVGDDVTKPLPATSVAPGAAVGAGEAVKALMAPAGTNPTAPTAAPPMPPAQGTASPSAPAGTPALAPMPGAVQPAKPAPVGAAHPTVGQPGIGAPTGVAGQPATPSQYAPAPADTGAARPVAPTQPVAAPAGAAPAAAPVAPGPRTAARDEVDELLGGGTTRPTAAPAPAPAPAPVAPAPAPRPVVAKPAAKPAADPADPPADASAERLLDDAQAAYVRGERQRAIDLALQVTSRGTPAEATKAWRFIGSAACSVRSATLASRAYTNLSVAEHRQLLAELCKRNGLVLQDGQFVSE